MLKLKSKRKPSTDRPSALYRTLTALVMTIAVAAPITIAFILVASTNEENPLDNIPNYDILPSETLVVPFDRLEPTTTEFEYWGLVRLFIEGTGQAAGAGYSDAFYLYTDEAGNLLDTPQTEMFDLELDGTRAIYTLGLADDPPEYSPEHLYAVLYDAGSRARHLTFRISDDVVDDNTGAFTITILKLEDE